MMRALISGADRLTEWGGRIAMALAATLFAVMLIEVFARYVLSAPTIWAYEISSMVNGCMFLFAAGYALRQGAHVSVDVLSARLPAKLRHAVLGLFYLLIFAPIVGLVEITAIGRAWSAWQSGEVAEVSVLRYQVWPFYAAIAVALAVFLAQLLAETLRHGRCAVRR